MTRSNPRTSRWERKDRIALIIILLLIIVIGYVALRPGPSSGAPSKSSFRADLMGRSIHEWLGSVRLQSASGNVADPFPGGKVYLLEFYFHRCPPCRLKHQALQKLDEVMDDSELEIIYIDNGKVDKIEEFRQRMDAAEKQYYDSAALFTRSLQVSSFPFEIIIDKEGIIRYVLKGFNKEKQEEYINETVDIIKSLQ